jgi:GSH-dependent disulfide-bond oxidoreductase
MITLYTFNTPNGHKASILLEELGLKYKIHKLDLSAGEHKSPEYMAISPIAKIPAVVEELPGGVRRRLFGSGAIMMHFAERTQRLLPSSVEARTEALSWFMMGLSDLGPAALDMFRFSVRAPERIPYAIDLFRGELVRCYQAMEARLEEVEYLAGEYSIADIACYPFFAVAAASNSELLDRYPNLRRWHDLVAARPAVIRGMAAPE